MDKVFLQKLEDNLERKEAVVSLEESISEEDHVWIVCFLEEVGQAGEDQKCGRIERKTVVVDLRILGHHKLCYPCNKTSG